MKTSALRLLVKIRRLSRRKGWSRAAAVQMLMPKIGQKEAEKQIEAIEDQKPKR